MNASGTTIILTTHYLEEAESLCRHVAIIDRGEITENDRMRNVLQKLKLQTFVLTLDHDVHEPPALPGFATRVGSEATLEVDVEERRTLNDLFAALDRAGLKVLSMRTKSNRLEELFIRLVEQNGVAAEAVS